MQLQRIYKPHSYLYNMYCTSYLDFRMNQSHGNPISRIYIHIHTHTLDAYRQQQRASFREHALPRFGQTGSRGSVHTQHRRTHIQALSLTHTHTHAHPTQAQDKHTTHNNTHQQQQVFWQTLVVSLRQQLHLLGEVWIASGRP